MAERSRLGGLARLTGGVRLRAAVVSVLIVGLALALSAFGMVALVRGALYASSTNTARAEALSIASFVTRQSLFPAHLPIADAETLAQVVAADGRVLASSRNIAGQAAMADLQPAPGALQTLSSVVIRERRLPHLNLDLDGRFVIAAVGLRLSGLRATVLVAHSLGEADHAANLVALSLGIAVPLIALLVGVLVYLLTGGALRPVEDLRAEVAELSATDFRRRVPEPRSDDEIGRLARTMNEMLGRLEGSADRQRQLVADVSHELRNPLAALQAQLEVAMTHPGALSASMIGGSLSEVRRMSRLVEDLLTLARLDDGMVPFRSTAVDLDELVLEQAERLRRNGRVEVVTRKVSAARVAGDLTQLTRVFANLADNAERYAQRQVEFAVVAQDDRVDVTVRDDGPGVPWVDRRRIFERFVRLDSARTHDGNGAGLGLAIVKEIVRAHEGEVWVEDAAPGARFVVRLPGPAPAETEEEAEEEAPSLRTAVGGR